VDFTDLEIFRAVAAEHSVTRAAQRLARVQSNVTTRIQQLEEELRVRLFLRDGKRMTLTAEGHRFLSYAETLLAVAEEARQSLHPETPSGHLRIGSMESTAASRLPVPLARYHALWPEVELRITTGTTRALQEDVLARRLDCALVAQSTAKTPPAGPSTRELKIQAVLPQDLGLDPGLEGIQVFTEELLLVMPASHPEVRRPDDLNLRTLAGFAQGCAYRQFAENWLASAARGPETPLKVLEMSSYHAILACVMAGSCVAILPKSVLDLQHSPLPLRTYSLFTVDTLLVRRTGYATSAYAEFQRVLQEL